MTPVKLSQWIRKGYLLVLVLLIALSSRLGYARVSMNPDAHNQAMVRAVGADNLTLVQRYLAAGADPNTVMRYLDEPWESRGFTPQALWLRIRGGPGAPMTRNGDTALLKAVAVGNPQMVQLLLDYGADVNKRGGFGGTSLSRAKEKNSVQIMHMLGRSRAQP